MFEGFERHTVKTSETEIVARIGGKGPALLLLHGYPQTHVMWHKVAPVLAEHFTVVTPDLRGYGDSGKPDGGPDHVAYSKRSMAQDKREVMQHFGLDRFHVVGHDRGGRVAHRLARDHRDAVESLTVLDICPTLHMYETTDMAFAQAYYHWFFLTQPYDFPERLIGADPEYYMTRKTGLAADRGKFAAEALAEYLRCFSNPETIHASCEDYRAAIGIDLVHDREDLENLLSIPILALWGGKGVVGRTYDVLDVWRRHTTGPVTGRALDCGHFLAEEEPEETVSALLAFLSTGSTEKM